MYTLPKHRPHRLTIILFIVVGVTKFCENRIPKVIGPTRGFRVRRPTTLTFDLLFDLQEFNRTRSLTLHAVFVPAKLS